MKIVALTEETKKNLLEDLLKRSTNDYGEYEKIVADIIEQVKTRKEDAIFEYSLKFDKCNTNRDNFEVSREEIEAAYLEVDERFIQVMKDSAKNIRKYHEKQKHNSWFDAKEDGTILGQKITPMNSVGVYVPGGKAAYPSTTLMNVVPAKVAGVPNIIMTTPAGADGKVNPATLVAADIAGVNKIFKVGGAQAIAALAYGTEMIPKVDKIVGPGNIFVALAKRAVYGHVSIDSIAGPSEILVLADESANPRYVAADLLSQAEHDAISPGWIDTAYTVYQGPDALQQPAGRVGNPMDIANMILFLASDQAGFITGENICIDGGMTRQMIYHGDHGWSLETREDT